MKLTLSQQETFNDIKKLWALKQSGHTEVADIPARTNGLIVGPSGIGKTFVARYFSQEFKIPLICLTTGSWIVLGAKNDTYTLNALAEFVDKHAFGLIFLDEINKFRNSHLREPWSMAVFNEVLALLDGDDRLQACGKFTPELVTKFRTNFMVIAAGAWQDEWQASKPRPVAGFTDAENSSSSRAEEFKKQIALSSSLLPDELIYRFNQRWLFILPPSEEELSERIVAIRQALDARPLTQEELTALVREAVDSDRSMRWLEAYVEQVIDETGLLQDRLSKMSALWPGRNKENEQKTKDYRLLYNSLLNTFNKLSLDCGALANRLIEELEYEHPSELNEELIIELGDFVTACHSFVTPFHNDTTRKRCFDKLRPLPKSLREALKAGLVGHASPDIRRWVVDLRQKLTHLDREGNHLQRVLSDKDELTNMEVPDHADTTREEWFKRN